MDDEKDIERLQSYLDEMADDGIKAKERLDNITPILLVLAAITLCTFGLLCYSLEKTNERLLRLEKIVQMDEIGRRK
jgi:hypothetical protein